MSSPAEVSSGAPPLSAQPLDCAVRKIAAEKSQRRLTPPLLNVDKEWVLAVAMAGAVVFTQSMLMTAGLLYVYFMEDFGASREAAAWPTNLKAAVFGIAGILLPLLHTYLSLFQIAMIGSFLIWISPMICAFAPDMTLIIIFLGAFQGAGMGIVETAVAVAIGTCFQKYRSIAMGLKDGGHTICGLIFPTILSSLEAEYGLRGALGVCGSLCLHVTAFMLTLRRESFTSRRQRPFKDNDRFPIVRPGEDTQTSSGDFVSSSSSKQSASRLQTEGQPVFINVSSPSGARGNIVSSTTPESKSQCESSVPSSDRGVLHNHNIDGHKEDIEKDQQNIFFCPGFYTILLIFAIAQYGIVAARGVIVDYAMDKGADQPKAELMVTYFAVSDFFGRMAIMAFADHGCMSRILVTVVALFLHAVTTLVLPLTSGFRNFLAVYLFSSMTQSTLSPLITVVVADYHGAHRIPLAWGVGGIVAVPLQFATPSITGKCEGKL
ncbi:monocarboxylate transporter 5-like isoform X1 [Haemaphysalis longicornis]